MENKNCGYLSCIGKGTKNLNKGNSNKVGVMENLLEKKEEKLNFFVDNQ